MSARVTSRSLCAAESCAVSTVPLILFLRFRIISCEMLFFSTRCQFCSDAVLRLTHRFVFFGISLFLLWVVQSTRCVAVIGFQRETSFRARDRDTQDSVGPVEVGLVGCFLLSRSVSTPKHECAATCCGFISLAFCFAPSSRF